ncbi:MAG: hypothetical protein FWG73_04400 [Planctomycetaceae bacterium]|nr:hypothetical protein [Planctomycetaceae bacterium]
MPFDPYALCPGGRDKKIRFCCPNMLKELEQVVKLLESNQPGACLSHIESLEKIHPNCACLTKAKISIYRAENRWDEVLPIAEQFHAQEPENPTASAEYALALIITGNPKLAYSTLVDAFERTQADTIHSTLLQAAMQVAVYSLAQGHTIPAIAIGNVLKEIPATAEQANMFLYRATAERGVPLLLRDWTFDFDCPSEFPGNEAFEEAAVFVRMMCWKKALALLEPLAHQAEFWPSILRNIATIHLWLLDEETACEALKMYAELPNVPLEDAVDASAMRMLFSPDTFGDNTEILEIEYAISDAEKAQELFLSAPAIQHVDITTWKVSPKPKSVFMVLDKPISGPETTLSLDNIASRLAVILLFGKETDKEARILVQEIWKDTQEMLETRLRDILGDVVTIPGNVMSQETDSRTLLLRDPRFALGPNSRPDPIAVGKVISDYYAKTFTESWLALPLGVLGGKTPTEAAKEPQDVITLLAAIQCVEVNLEDDTNFGQTVRARLGLPEQGVITVDVPVSDDPEADPLTALDSYPVWRWHRFDVSKFSTELLAGGLQVALGMQEFRAAGHFAEELLNRPMDSMPFPPRIMAFEAMIGASQSNRDIEQALLWVERAKNECAAKSIPDAAWYLHEVTLNLASGNSPGVSNAINYLVTNFGEDADVMSSLQELFVQLGMFNPDGTPTAAWLEAMQSSHSPGQEEPRLWTPDGEVPSANPSKLWTPD